MRVLIVEDEPVVARRLERLLREVAGDAISRVTVHRSLSAAQDYLADAAVDVVFLDLNLNGRDGFDLLRQTVAGSFHTVVVSAHTDRALEAFEIGVLDFVGKPFDADRLRVTLERLRGVRRADHAATVLAVRTAGRIDLVPIAAVAFVQAAGAYSELVLRDGSRRVHDKSIDRLLAVLPPTFERVHRSFLVPLDEVVRLTVREGSRYAVVLRSGDEIPVGRTRVDAVRARLVGP